MFHRYKRQLLFTLLLRPWFPANINKLLRTVYINQFVVLYITGL